MSKRKFSAKMNGKGYYIALILCAVAIGITGYLYYRNADNDAQMSNDPVDVVATDGLEAVATQPGTTTPDATTDATEPKPTEKSLKTAAPVAGETVAEYAMDCLSYNATTRDWRVHNGIDIAAEAGTPVMAAAAGEVYTVYDDDTMGKTVVIRHAGGYTTRYASLGDDVAVEPGKTVALGEKIGTVGQSALMETALGDHLHFSVTLNDKTIDPAKFLAGE
ncbi:MAG: M23 family metallopeptidase [Oscillospiraceae bacterium]|nr:M23 family metallopeptidase [Oscillospiraceae bacterium]